ncbi:hypothetical protein ACLOJK_016377 [Asimina triloba]
MYGTPPEYGAPVWCSIIFPNPAHLHLRRPATHDGHAVQQLTPITWASHDRARMVHPSRSIQRSHEPAAHEPIGRHELHQPQIFASSSRPSRGPAMIRCPRSRASRPHPPPELDGHDPASSPSSAAPHRNHTSSPMAHHRSGHDREQPHHSPLPAISVHVRHSSRRQICPFCSIRRASNIHGPLTIHTP